MSTARELYWFVPGNDYTEVRERRGGKKGKGALQEYEVHLSSGPRTFTRSADAYKHARTIHLPLREVEMATSQRA